MNHSIAGKSNHNQMRGRLQSQKSSLLSLAVPDPEQKDNKRAIGAAVDTLLKYSGFHGRGRRNCPDYRLVRNDVYLPYLPAAFDGYTILHLSDLHADGLVDGGEGIIRIIKAAPCDLAVLTGDFSSEDSGIHYESSLEALAPIIRSISALDGVFGVPGNHDFLDMIPNLEQMGVRILLNEAVQLHRGTEKIVLAGVDDPNLYKCHDLHNALSGVTPGQCVILLSHSPEIATEASMCGVDFYLCGHTDGNQVCLPGGIGLFANVSCLRRYVSGSWKCGTMQGYTSSGAGFSLMAACISRSLEITLHTLHSGTMPCESCETIAEKSRRWFNVAGHAVYA